MITFRLLVNCLEVRVKMDIIIISNITDINQLTFIISFRLLQSPELCFLVAAFSTPSATLAANPRSECPASSSRRSEDCSPCSSAHSPQRPELSAAGEALQPEL